MEEVGLRNFCRLMTGSPNPNLPIQRYTERKFLMQEHEGFVDSQRGLENEYTIFNSTIPAPQSQCGSTSKVDLIPQNRVGIADLKNSVSRAIKGKFFLCRSIARPYRLNALSTAVDDPEGEFAVRLFLYNFTHAKSLSELQLVLPVGTILAIKNPFFKVTADMGYSVRSDNPANIIFIDNSLYTVLFSNLKWRAEIPAKYQYMATLPHVNLRTNAELKTLGNKYFKEKNYSEALKAYTSGLDISRKDTELLANRCATYLNLEKYDDALKDAEAVLKMEPGELKVVVRKIRALCGLKEYKEALEFMQRKCTELKEGDATRGYLDKLKKQMQKQLKGEYDMLYFMRNKGTRFLDCAEFVGNVEIINIPKKGRGFAATTEIKACQLIMACKAFSSVFQESGSGFNEQFSLNPDFKSRRIYSSNHRRLVFDISRRLTLNPELGKEFYKLYAGPEMMFLDPEKGDDCSVVDMDRINGICTFNMFGCVDGRYSNSMEVLWQDSASGLWILPSFLNHSCLSNTFWCVCGDFLFIRACKDISIGQEITITYIRPLDTYENRIQLFRGFEFICDRELCKLDKDEIPEIHIERKRILDRIKDIPKETILTADQMNQLQSAVAELEKFRPGGNQRLNYCTISPQITLSMTCFGLSNFIESVEILKKVYALCEYSLIDIAVFASMNIVTSYIQAGQLKKAKKWANILKRNLVVAYGSTRPLEVIGNMALQDMKANGIFI